MRWTARTREVGVPVDVRAALRAVRTLLADPDDTGQVFVIVRALTGNSALRGYRRFARSGVGKRVVREQFSLLDKLSDHAALGALSEGSLGRAYLKFMADEKITADGLVAASEEVEPNPNESPGMRLYRERLRDMHDLWHVVTGYKGDLVGESALLAFTFAQTRNPGVGFIVVFALLKGARMRRDIPGLILRGFARGLFAKWLPAQDWEALLASPVTDVRRQLRIDKPPAYDPIRTDTSATRLKTG